VRALEYVAAAECTGASNLRIIFGEILPNISPPLFVVATVEAASAILLEAALSFLGLGVQPPVPSWGPMIAEAKNYMFFWTFRCSPRFSTCSATSSANSASPISSSAIISR
jgi:peptide/nickel transport system permease protein